MSFELKAELTCLSCRHFRREPLPAGPVLVGSTPTGECRHSPPQAVALPTARGLSFVSIYPKVSDDFPACSRHTAARSISPEPPSTPTDG